MQSIHPDIISNWKEAKRAAAVLAQAAGCYIVQMPDGSKGLRMPSGNIRTCTTWLGVYELVSRIRRDQITAKK